VHIECAAEGSSMNGVIYLAKICVSKFVGLKSDNAGRWSANLGFSEGNEI
jgi:hypothetical protein